MRRSTTLTAAILAAATLVSTTSASTVTSITNQTTPGWGIIANSGATALAINNDQPRSGNGSLMLSVPAGARGGVYAHLGGSVSSSTNYPSLSVGDPYYGTLGTLNSLSFDWYRDSSSTTADTYSPIVKLWVVNTSFQIVQLDYGRADNTSITNADNTWYTENLINQKFWNRSNNTNFEQSGNLYTLPQWTTGIIPSSGGVNGFGVNANSVIIGIEIGFGETNSGNFKAYVDNLSIGFSTGTSYAYNFETVGTANGSAVPLPSSALAGSALLAGLALVARRRASV